MRRTRRSSTTSSAPPRRTRPRTSSRTNTRSARRSWGRRRATPSRSTAPRGALKLRSSRSKRPSPEARSGPVSPTGAVPESGSGPVGDGRGTGPVETPAVRVACGDRPLADGQVGRRADARARVSGRSGVGVGAAGPERRAALLPWLFRVNFEVTDAEVWMTAGEDRGLPRWLPPGRPQIHVGPMLRALVATPHRFARRPRGFPRTAVPSKPCGPKPCPGRTGTSPGSASSPMSRSAGDRHRAPAARPRRRPWRHGARRGPDE